MHAEDIDQYELIRKWVRNGEHLGSLGKWGSVTGNEGEAFWLGSPTLIGSRHPDGSRMAISIECYRGADTGGYREIVKAFDALHAKHFPPRKTLVKRGTPTTDAGRVQAHVQEADSSPGGLFDTAAEIISEEVAPRRKLVRRGSPS